jgi:hypothetical protein
MHKKRVKSIKIDLKKQFFSIFFKKIYHKRENVFSKVRRAENKAVFIVNLGVFVGIFQVFRVVFEFFMKFSGIFGVFYRKSVFFMRKCNEIV